MVYHEKLGRYLALCLTNGITLDGAYYVADNIGYKLGSPELVETWGSTYRFQINAEIATLAQDMDDEQVGQEQEETLGAICCDELELILLPNDTQMPQGVQDDSVNTQFTLDEPLQSTERIDTPRLTEPPTIQTPFEIEAINHKLDTVLKILHDMRKAYLPVKLAA